MALRKVKSSINLSCVPVILENDDAIDHDNEECDYQMYVKTGDISHLRYVSDKEPTKFICNFSFSGKEAAMVKNSMIGSKDEEGKPSVSLGSWQFRIARLSLKDIQNPAYLPEDECFVMKNYDGYADEKLLAVLNNYGVIDAIFSLYSSLVLDNGVRAEAKNS
jgi:hypothetical protein